MTDKDFALNIQLILEGNKNGLKEIYMAYGKLIYQTMLAVVKSPQDAEDLTNDFFLKLWDTADNFRTGSGHRRYISVMARNLALDFLRKHRREQFTIDDDTGTEQTDFADTQAVDDSVIGSLSFNQALERLSTDEREILNLHLGMELTFREIAQVLNKPAGTVAWKYRNAVAKLRKLAKEDSIYG